MKVQNNVTGQLCPAAGQGKQKIAARSAVRSYRVARAEVHKAVHSLAKTLAIGAPDKNTRRAAAQFLRRLEKKGGRP